MISHKNKSLRQYNSFGINAHCADFYEIKTESDLINLLPDESLFVLGGGSNMLLTKDLSQKVIHMLMDDIVIQEEANDHVIIKVGAGKVWHDLVLWCIQENYGGLENLSLIPGNVGASPIQNIGAYGVELKDIFHGLDAIDKKSGLTHHFTKSDCDFGYRDSVFKNDLKNRFVITQVCFRLTTKNHRLETSYKPLHQTLADQGITHPTIKDISDAVIQIRQSKLPDPKQLGNAGSFFKNPIISDSRFQGLQNANPDIPSYPAAKGFVKIPAAWLIDQCQWKGYRIGDAGVHEQHALVLVNYGTATGSEIYKLAQKIQSSVLEKFGIGLKMEVNIL